MQITWAHIVSKMFGGGYITLQVTGCSYKWNEWSSISRIWSQPGSIPSVFGAPAIGAKMVVSEIVTFLQSYVWRVQKGESRRVILEMIMLLDRMSWTRGPLVWLRSFLRNFTHQLWPCPFMVPLWPILQRSQLKYYYNFGKMRLRKRN